MRISTRPLATLLLAVGVATCSDTPIATVKSAPGPSVRARLSIQTTFSRSAQFVAQHADDFGIRFDAVHIIVRNTPDTAHVVKDTVVAFSPDAPDKPLDLDVPVQTDNQRFDVYLAYTLASAVQWSGHGIFQSHPPDAPAPPQGVITLDYHGPGATVANIAITPKTATLNGTQSTTLSVSATDSSGASIATPPLRWTSSDPTIASVSSPEGVVQAQNRRGTVTITAEAPTGATDNASITVTLPPSAIVLVSGGGQTGKVSAALPTPAVVQVNAVDGTGVAGVNVIFSPPTGGAVGTTSATTDANGRASTTLKLGTTVGPQSFAATAAGFSVAIPAAATAGDPAAIAIVAGNTQSDSVHARLAPLSVRVTDNAGNRVSGASVAWTRTSGSGSLGSATSTTDNDGVAMNTYTLGSVVGPDVVTASIGSVSAAFSFTAIHASASAILAVSGNGQTGAAGAPLSAPFVVRVTDAGGNAVANTAVSWSATNGTIAASTTTDSSGRTSATLNAGTTLGAATATASIANGQNVVFTATLQPGAVSQLTFSTQPANGIPNVVLPPVHIALRDVGGNATTAANPVTLALGNNPNGAVLTGTLTRNAVNGVATFDDLKLDKAGTGYTLVATTGSLPSVTSTGFNTAVGSAATLAIVGGDNQSATVNAAVASPLSVKVADAANNPVPGVVVTFAPSSGSVSPSNGQVTTDASGVATLTSWTLGTTAGAQSIIASATGTSSVTFHATAAPSAAAKLAITSIATAAVSGQPFSPQPTVQLEDQFGNAVPAGTMTIVASATPSSGTTISGGSASVNATTGVATFSNLSVLTTAPSITLTFAVQGAPSIQTVTSSSIAVRAATPTQLVLVPSTPTSYTKTAGGALSPSPKIEALDASNNAVPSAAMQVVVKQGTTQISSTNLIADASGLIDVANIAVPNTAGAYTVTASLVATPLATVTVTITVIPGSATGLAINGGNTQSTTVNTAVATAPSVKVVDGSNNPVAGVVVTFAPANGSGSVSPANGEVTTDATGIATLTSWTLGTTAGPQSLVASTPGASNVTFTATATAGAATKLAISSMATGAVSGQPLNPQPSVQLEDQFGNAATAGAATIVASATPSSGTTISGGSTSANATTGAASFTNLSVLTTASSVTLTFAVQGQSSIQTVTSPSIAITAATPTQLVLVPATPTSFTKTAGSPLSPAPKLKALDVSGNPVPSVAVQFVVKQGTTVQGTATLNTDASGLIDGANVTTPDVAGVYTLTASLVATPTATLTLTVNVIPGSATGLAVNGGNNQNATVNTAVAIAPSVKVVDASNNPVAGVAVTFTPGNGSGSVSPANGQVTTDATGIATLTSWTLGTTAGPQSLVAAAQGLSSVTLGATAGAGAPTKLAITSIATGAVSGQLLNPPPTVQVEDQFGNAAPAGTMTIVASATPSDGTTISGGSVTANPTTGVAAFSNLSVLTTASNVTLTFAAQGQPTIQTVTSSSIAITAATPTQLVLVPSTPTSFTKIAGAPLSPGPKMKALDVSNNAVPAAAMQVVVKQGTTQISSTNLNADASGLIDIGNLAIPNTAGSYTVTASLVATPSATATVTVNVIAGGAAGLSINGGNNQSATVSAAVAVAPSVKVVDASNNPVAGVVVTFAPANGSGTVSPANAQATTNATGVATLTSWTLGTTAGPQSLVASAQGLTSVTFDATANAGAATKLAISSMATAAVSGQAFNPQPTVQLEDQFGNATAAGAVTIVASASSGTTTSGGSAPANATTGAATFTNLSVLTTAPSVTLTFAVQGQSSIQTVTSPSIAITAATPTQLVLDPTTPTTYTKAAGAALSPSPKVKALDASNNVVPNAALQFVVKQGSTQLSGVNASADGSGVYDIANLATPNTVGSYTVTASLVATPSATLTVTINVTPGAATGLAINGGNNQSATVSTAVAIAPSVKVVDVSNNPVAGVVVTFAPANGSGTVSPADGQVTTDATGVATLTSWTLGTTAGAQSLIAAVQNLSNVAFSATAAAGAATKLAIASIATEAVSGQTLNPQPTVQLQDQFGNSTAGGAVTVVASATPSSGTTITGGSALANATTGAVSFTNLSVLTTASNVALTFAVQGTSSIQSVTSSSIAVTAATPTQLVLVPSTPTSYTKTAGGALSSSPKVKALDVSNNAVPDAAMQVVVKQGSTQISSTNVNADASGLIDLASVAIPNTAGSYTVTASLIATPSATVTVTITVIPGSATGLAVNGGNTQSTTVNTAVATAPSVKVVDASNNPVAGVVVTFAPANGSGTVAPANGQVTTDATGVATLTSWTLGTTAGPQSLVASAQGLTSVTFGATANASVAAKLAITSIATAAVSGQPFSPQPTVQLEDQFGNAVPAGTMTIVASATPSAGTTVSGGSVAANPTTGVAAFSNLSVLTTAPSITLTFAVQGAPSIQTVTSSSIAITAATPTQLVLVPSTPTSYTKTAGGALSPSPKIEALDASNNAVPSAAMQVVVKQGSTQISSTNVNADASGLIDLANIAVPNTAGSYTVTASLVATPSAIVTVTITVIPGSATGLAINGGNSQSTTVNTAVATAPSVKVVDASNNPVAGVVVTFAPANGSGTVAPANGQVTTDATGVATLTSWTLGTTAGPQSLVASAQGLTSVTFDATANAGAATKLAISSMATAAVSGQAFNPQPAVQLEDQFGNAAAAGAVTIVASATPSSGTTISGGSTSANATTGAAWFTNLSVLTTAPSVTLTFAVQGQSSIQTVTSSSIAITAATPTQLVLVPSTPTSYTKTAGGALSPSPKIEALDASNNAVPSAAMQVVVKQGSTQISSTNLNADASGLIDVANIAVPNIAGAYTVTASLVATPSATVTVTINVIAGSAGNLAINRGNDQSATINTAVATPPSVKVTDGSNNPVAGAIVTFTPANGSGTVSPANGQVTTDATGVATLTSWTLGATAGSQSLVASTSGATSVTFSATANASSADHLVIQNGATMVVDVSAATTFSGVPAVTVQDAFNNPVPNATVYWWTNICAGGFSLNGSSTQANASGAATAPSLTIPANTPGSCLIVASLNTPPAQNRRPVPRPLVNRRPPGPASLDVNAWMPMPPSSEAAFYAIVRPVNANTWTNAAGDSAWFTSGNWSSGTPISTSTLFIPAAVSGGPNLSADAVAGNITLENSFVSHVSLNLHTLTVSGSVDASGSGINNGTLFLNSSIANTSIKGTLPTTTIGSPTSCGSGSYQLTGATIAGPVTLNCALDVGEFSLQTLNGGGLTVGGSAGKLIMTTGGGSIDIAGTATFSGTSETGSLTNGVARFNGGLTTTTGIGGVTDTYASTLNHQTQFTGSTTQHVSVASGTSFNAIDFAASSHVYFDNSATINGSFTVGNGAEVETGTSTTALTLLGDASSSSGSRLDGVQRMVLAGGTHFPHFSGTTPASMVVASAMPVDQSVGVTGSLDVQSALTMNPSVQMTVGGNFSTSTSTGKLVMQGANSLVDVSGTSTFDGASELGSLTAGVFEARGDFVQATTNSTSSFAPTLDHKTSLWGGSDQSVTFADWTNSFFNDVEVKNPGITATFTTPTTVVRDFSITSVGGMAQAAFSQPISIGRNLTANANTSLVEHGVGNRIIVGGAVTANATADLGGVDSLRVTGSTFPVYNNTTAGKSPRVTQLTGTVSLAHDQTVSGGLSIGTNLDLAGHTLSVLDSVVVSGNLKFQSATPANTLKVGGLFKIDRGNVVAQAGTLEVAGDFNEAGSTTTAFQPQPGFLTKLTGTSGQSVSFSHASSSQSYFADLTVQSTNAGATFGTNGYVTGSLIVDNGAVLKTTSGAAITANGSVTTRSGSTMAGVAELIVNGTTFPSFTGASPAKTTIARGVTMTADATLTGGMSVQDQLSIAGHKLFIGGDFTVEGSGLLKVLNPADSIVVGGNAEFKGGSQDDFPFTAGAFDFKGNFKSSGTKTFYVSSNHSNTARFTGTSGTQTIDISGESNSFQNLVVTNRVSSSSSVGGLIVTTDASIGGTLDVMTGAILTINSDRTLIAPAVNLHSGSAVHVAGTFGNGETSCRAHDSQFGGTNPTLDGAGSFITNTINLETLFGVCSRDNIP